jgi:hypothetical protein
MSEPKTGIGRWPANMTAAVIQGWQYYGLLTVRMPLPDLRLPSSLDGAVGALGGVNIEDATLLLAF